MQYDEGGSTGQRRAECNGRRNGKRWEKEWKRMGEGMESDKRRNGKGWEKERKRMREGMENGEKRNGKGWEKEREAMGEETENGEKRNGKGWEKEREAMGEETENGEKRNGKGWEKEREAIGEGMESDGRRKPALCPGHLHYRRTSDAVRCIRACSALQTSTQRTASGNAAHCVFLPKTLPLPRHAAWTHSSCPSTTEASRLWTCLPVPGGFRWN